MEPKPMNLHLKTMATRRIQGQGRLIPAQPTGIQYRVSYGIHIAPDIKQHGRGMRPVRWTKCSVRPAGAHRIPNGDYFLHADEGGVYQMRCTGTAWQYLAAA